MPGLVLSGDAGTQGSLCTSCVLLQTSLTFSPQRLRGKPFCSARETEPLTMVATGSLSSKNPASISELLDGAYHPGSLLSGESPGCSRFSYPKVAAPL